MTSNIGGLFSKSQYDASEVDKDILAVLTAKETVALESIEPLHRADNVVTNSLIQ